MSCTSNTRIVLLSCVVTLSVIFTGAGPAQAAITGYAGPGGFEATNTASSLLYWLDADPSNITESGGSVSAWADRGFNGYGFLQGTAVNQPSYDTSTITIGGNNLPAVQFDGDNSDPDGGGPLLRGAYSDKLVLGISTSPQTVFLVNNTFQYQGTDGIWGYHDSDYGIRRTSTAWSHPGNANDFTNSGNMHVNGASTNAAGLNTPHILAATGSDTYSASNLGNYFRYGHPAGSRAWNGDIGEVVVYDRTLNTAEINIVENHLSAKYGIAMAANDHYAGDGSVQGNYDLDVIGIGRDDASNARTSAGNAGLGIEQSGSLADGAFVMAGHKVAANSLVTADVPAGHQRWDRVWYVDNAATADAQLTFDYGNAGLAAPGASTQFALIHSVTNTFSFSQVDVTPTVTGDQVSFSLSGDDLRSGYYTVQQVSPNTGPGGFESTDTPSDLLYWLKADSGVTKDGNSKVSNWADQGADGRDFSQSADNTKPVLVDGEMGGNGLPVIRFDGDQSGEFSTIDKLVMSDSTTPDTIIIVNRLITDGSLGGIIGKNNADKGIRRLDGNWRSPGDYNDFTNTDGTMFINGTETNTVGVDVPHILTATHGDIHDNSYTTTVLGQYFYGTSRAYNGDIAEVIVYDRVLNSAEISIVENHLSAKYDLPIGNDHYAGDELTKGDYDLDVIGIGRVDASNELTEASALGLGIKATGGTLGDDEWVMAGHKTPVNAWVTTDLPAPANQRWDRVWYIDVDGLVDTELTFDLGARII